MEGILVLLLVGFLLKYIAAEGPCEAGWIYHPGEEIGKCYYVNTTKGTQVESARRCEEMGAYLACIATHSETEFIRQKLNESGFEESVKNQYWIGLYKETKGETSQDGWAWIDNTPYVWRNWNDNFGEPAEVEKCARLSSHRDWLWAGAYCDSVFSDFKFGYICEKNAPAPSQTSTNTASSLVSTSEPPSPGKPGDETGDSNDNILIGFGTALGCLCVIFVVVIFTVVWILRKRHADHNATDPPKETDVMEYENPPNTDASTFPTPPDFDTGMHETVRDPDGAGGNNPGRDTFAEGRDTVEYEGLQERAAPEQTYYKALNRAI